MAVRLRTESATFVVIDWQEKLFPAMESTRQTEALCHATNLYWLASELSMPIVVSEQYPQGLGPTVPALRTEGAVEKVTFSAWEADAFSARLAADERRQIVLCGMETHICVAQTCRDLIDVGFEVWVVADACLSRRPLDWELGLDRMRKDGARITTAEAVGFELLSTAKHPQFRGFSKRIR